MIRYLAKRILLLIPTLLVIIAINFFIVQLAPGGPVETVLARLHAAMPVNQIYRGAQGLSPAALAALKSQFGFGQPPLARFWRLLKGDLTFHLGNSFFSGQPVLSLIAQRLPVSLSLGLWSTLIVYAVSLPLGIAKAVRAGRAFDVASTLLVLALFAIPGFLLAVFLITLLGAGGLLPLFPLRGLASPDAASLPWPARLADYGWHLVLPTLAMTAGGFAALTMLVKNSFLEEINKLYVLAARARGASPARVLYVHVFRNAMLVVVAGFPAAFMAILFSSSLLVEIIFSLDGLGQLGYQAALQRDYPVMFGTLYVYTLTGLALRIIGDVLYAVIDPRIDFDRRV